MYLCLSVLFALQCASVWSEVTREVVHCVVAIPPMAFLADAVGGERTEVHTLLRAGQSPETYDPTARQLAVAANADIFFQTGFAFEHRLADKLAGMGGLRVIDAGQGLRMPLKDLGCEAAHAHDTKHDHGGEDPHLWLDPVNARLLAARIAAGLSAVDPDGAEDYGANLMVLEERLAGAEARIREILAPVEGREFLVYHPAWAYFARRFKVTQIAIEHEGKEPGARHLQRIVERFGGAEGLTLFVDPLDSGRRSRMLADRLGATCVIIDPLAYDYLDNLVAAAHALHRALEPHAIE